MVLLRFQDQSHVQKIVMARKTKKVKAALLIAVAFLLAAIAFLWRVVFPKRSEGDETSILDDLQYSLTSINPLMSAKKTAEAIIKKWEGLYLKAYKDTAGKWTIGWGTIKYKNGKYVKEGDVITKEQAQSEFDFEFEEKWKWVTTNAKVPLTDGQIASLVSFAYNVGIGEVKPTKTGLAGSTLWEMLNAGKSKKEVAPQFLRWVYSGGKYTAGLENRRRDEMNLFLT